MIKEKKMRTGIKGNPKRIWIITTTFFTNVLEKPLQKVFHKSPPKNTS
jgi:hypothetical protein